MGATVFIVVLLLLGIAAVAWGFTQPGMRIAALGGAAAIIIALVTTLVTCAVQVPTKEYGVVTSFGKPIGVFSNGLHWKAPWQQVTTIDAAIQTDAYEQNSKGDGCINVRIAHQATACVDVSIRWRIKESATKGLFQNYRSFDNIRDSLTVRELSSSLNNVMGDFDPLSVDGNGNADTPPLTTISSKVKTAMTTEIGDQVEVLSIFIPVVHFDSNTQSKVNALLGQVAQTRIAAQGVKTAEQQAKANETLSKSVSKDPNVLVNKCLDLIESGKLVPPAGFSCWPGSSSSVVVPSASSSGK